MPHNLNEADTRAELIDPALALAGWGQDHSRVRREVISQGRLLGGGKRTKQDIADYVLTFKGHKLAVIEAKKTALPVTEGLAQAKRYAERLQTRFAYATNGLGIYQVDMHTGVEGPVDKYPSPQELWDMTFAEANVWRDRFALVPFEDKGGSWEARYYQHNAINAVLEKIARGEDRILLTLATGTGKTCIAFQLAWKLFHSRWNLKDWRGGTEPSRRPRILFLADRNILANQAFNDFSAFEEDALVRISPDAIRKKKSVPMNGNIFFTIFQTFMSGKDEHGNQDEKDNPVPCFGEYPPDFFDFIIIDECHRGGARDESTWRAILEYFAPAVQLGLTATPRRENNIDTYAYFGDPVYIYSLKEGINDGYLTPFKVKQIATTLDDYIYTSDDDILDGEIEDGKRYEEHDFNVSIEIQAREAYRVRLFMDCIDQKQKTIVFCANQYHALIVRDMINQYSKSRDVNYCHRVTANDGASGEGWLRQFQDNEKTIPTILTTSLKLSTGVDARNVRNIVLMRPVKSMIEFKQIVGRGTRLFDGKEHFTIYDFVEAYKHFSDPEWDGEPLAPETCEKCGQYPCVCPKEAPKPCDICGMLPCVCPKEMEEPCPDCGNSPCTCRKRKKKIVVQLADGKERTIQHMMLTSFWSPDGKPMSSSEFITQLYGELPHFFKDEDELRALWGRPDTRKKLLSGLEDKGYGHAQLLELQQIIEAPESDLFDVLAYIAFRHAPISRKERVTMRREHILDKYSDPQQDFLDFVLSHYVDQGVRELDQDKLPSLLELKYQSIDDAVAELGSVAAIRGVFVDFQQGLYMGMG